MRHCRESRTATQISADVYLAGKSTLPPQRCTTLAATEMWMKVGAFCGFASPILAWMRSIWQELDGGLFTGLRGFLDPIALTNAELTVRGSGHGS